MKLQALMTKYAPTDNDYDEHVVKMDIEMIRDIAALNTEMDCSEDRVSNEMIRMSINTLSSDAITPEEAALGTFNRKRLKLLSNLED